MILTENQKKEFFENGFLIIKNFYDVENEILPIQKSIYQIIDFVIARHSLDITREPFKGHNFDNNFQELIALDESFGAEIYDLTKQIPSFIRLISSKKAEDVICLLRNTNAPGIGQASYGIRIDNPLDEKFRAHWHQEFIFQPQSMDGIIFWTPLLTVSKEMGPLNVCLGSHKDGLCIYDKTKYDSKKSGAYTIGIHDEKNIVSKYKKYHLECEPGDLIIMDFLTIHQSGLNDSNRSRWSVQSRFFNFKEKIGAKIGWKASVTAGSDVEKIFPENFVEKL